MEILLGTYENFILGYSYPKLEQTFNIKQHNAAVKSINVNHNTGLMASAGSDENVHLLNLKTRKEFGSLFSHNDKISSVNFDVKTNTLYWLNIRYFCTWC